MILPTKHITVTNSLIGVGALLIEQLEKPASVSILWEKVREYPEVATFERFILGLDLLFLLGIIKFEGNKVRRVIL